MILYHYTSRYHLPRIEADGQLRTTESNARLDREHAAPDVVWLTTADWGPQGWQVGSVVDKGEVRLTVRVPNAERWDRWARRHGVPAEVKAALAASGGDWRSWYVSERAIPREDWLAVETRPSG